LIAYLLDSPYKELDLLLKRKDNSKTSCRIIIAIIKRLLSTALTIDEISNYLAIPIALEAENPLDWW
ncbi:8581_t:CDS:2, partial [Funneliformis geosporum]